MIAKVKGREFKIDEEYLQSVMREWGFSREEAVRDYFEQIEFLQPGDKDKITIIEGNTKRRYEKSATAPKERKSKVDKNKEWIFNYLLTSLSELNVSTTILNRELSFTYNDEEYTIKLVKHRKKEKK